LKSPSSFQAQLIDGCNIDAAPETSDFYFNRFKEPKDY
jgi:hypothetical protein